MELLRKFLFETIGIFLAFLSAEQLIPQVKLEGSWKTTLFISIFLALINIFIKPLLNLITFPLRILTFGFISLILNMAIIWLIDILFPEIQIIGLLPLFFTTIFIFAFSFLFSRLERKYFLKAKTLG